MIHRRDFAMLLSAASGLLGRAAAFEAQSDGFSYTPEIESDEQLHATVGAPIKVAFAINSGARVIDTVRT